MGQILLGGLFSFLITLVLLPLLIRFAKAKQFFVPLSFRRVHKGKVSALGGVAIFLSTFLSVIFFSDFIDFAENRYLLAAGVLMFMLGLQDDMKDVSAWVKLIVQILVAFVVVYPAGYQIWDFSFLDSRIHITGWGAELLTIGFILLIVNAYNFIDGVDLQAALVAIVILAPFGWWFFVNDQYDSGLLLFSLGLSLLAFALFNYSPAKIFLGDMGTLIIGLLLAISFIRFSQLHIDRGTQMLYELKNPYIFVLSAFVLPIADLVRVSATRVLKGNSPLKGDRNHIHHWLLKLGWKQNHVAFFTSGFTLGMIVLNFFAQREGMETILLVLLDLALVTGVYLYFSYRLRKQKLLER